MARVRKPQPTHESILFVTPEQKVLRLLISEPTTTFTLRTISSRLKGVRGLGGVEGIMKILTVLEELDMVSFVDNRRAVRLQDDNSTVRLLKTLSAACDLEGLINSLKPLSSKGILFGSRASGTYLSDSDYNLFIVGNDKQEIEKITSGHPLGKRLDVTIWPPDQYAKMKDRDPKLEDTLSRGVVLWGTAW